MSMAGELELAAGWGLLFTSIFSHLSRVEYWCKTYLRFWVARCMRVLRGVSRAGTAAEGSSSRTLCGAICRWRLTNESLVCCWCQHLTSVASEADQTRADWQEIARHCAQNSTLTIDRSVAVTSRKLKSCDDVTMCFSRKSCYKRTCWWRIDCSWLSSTKNTGFTFFLVILTQFYIPSSTSGLPTTHSVTGYDGKPNLLQGHFDQSVTPVSFNNTTPISTMYRNYGWST